MNMFQSAWTRHRPTPQVYTPIVQEVQPEVIVPKVSVEPRIESHQIMGKEVPQSVVEKFEHSVVAAPVIESIRTTVEPTPVIETPVGTDIDVATTGPVEVDLSRSEVATLLEENCGTAYLNGEQVSATEFVESASESELAVLSKVANKILDAKSVGNTIIQTRDEIDRSNEVVNYVDARKTPTYEEHVSDVNTTLQGIGKATTEDAYTYGINRLKNNKKPVLDDWIVGHIFGGTYDLWISEYIEDERVFFGFASFGGLFDQDAEWGYVSIDEILGLGFPKPERDFYWTPCTLQSLKDAEQKAYDQKEQAIQLGADVDEEEPEEDTWSATKIKDKELVKAIKAKSVCLAAGYWYTPLSAESPINWRLNEDITAYWNLELEE